MDQFHSIGSLVEMGDQVDSPLNHLRRDGLYSMRRAIAEFRVQLRIAERAFRRARGAGRFQCSGSSIRPPHHNLGPALWTAVTPSTLDACRQGEDTGVVNGCDFPNANFPTGQGGSYQEWRAELGFHHLRRTPFVCPRAKLILVGLRVGGHHHLSDALALLRGGEVELLVECQRHVEGRMARRPQGYALKLTSSPRKTVPRPLVSSCRS